MDDGAILHMHFPVYKYLMYILAVEAKVLSCIKCWPVAAIMAESDDAECNWREGIYSSMMQKNDVIEQYS